MFRSLFNRLPDADEVFRTYFDRWYTPEDRARKQYSATRPDLDIRPGLKGRAAAEVSLISPEAEAKSKDLVEGMLAAARADWAETLNLREPVSLEWVAVFDRAYNAAAVKSLLKGSDASDASNLFVVTCCEFGAVLGHVLREARPNLEWVYGWPYWESALFDSESGTLIPPFHWAIKKFSSYGVNDGYRGKFEACVHHLQKAGEPVTPEREARRVRSEARLAAEKIADRRTLPCIESEEEITLRTRDEIGARIVCLVCVLGRGEDEEHNPFFREYLEEHDLLNSLSPYEASFLEDANPDRHSRIQISWQSEALFVLMWAVGLFDTLPMPRQQVDSRDIMSRLPDPGKSPHPFIERLELRPKAEILDAADLIYRLHWEVRNADLNGRKPPGNLVPGVVQEWHHAINWLIRTEDEEWDHVPTDT